MKNAILFFLTLTIFSVHVNSQIVYQRPLSPRYTNYKIKAFLNTDTKTVSASMEAFWVNYSPNVVNDVQLHMYMNAFKDLKSTFMKESGIRKTTDNMVFGHIDLISLTDNAGNDLTRMMSYISPDDGNPDDQTVLRVNLPTPANPGDTVFIHADFETKLPSRIIRTGFNNDFYFIAQWFPKFGVYEPAGMRNAIFGSWNCHQFHRNSEFYANHSVYDVTITLPRKYIVGSCGLLLKEDNIENDQKILTYRAEDIVDFAWTAWPGYAVYKDKWNDVNITLLSPPERQNQVVRQFTAIKYALEYLNDKVGPYPWPYVTIVDPPAIGSGSDGMEYTTMFTSSSFYNVPTGIRMPEMVTVHEFGHAYFMGILATNEFEEPWMDEGINSFWEERIIDNYYGENSGLIDFPLLKISDKALSRSSYATSGSRSLISNNENSWSYPNDTYSMMSYNKSSVWLYTLMALVGEETMDNIFREYYNKWAFKHPCAKDFIAIVNDVVHEDHGNKFGTDMNWFFDQTLYGTGICDYRLISIENSKSEEKSESDTVTLENTTRSIIKVARDGDVKLPVTVLFKFENGSEELREWDGKERYHEWTFIDKGNVIAAIIDPDYKIRLDINFINNSLVLNPNRVPLKTFSSKAFMIVQFLLGMILI